MKNLARRFPVYNKALKLYPLVYQQRYAEQMLQTLADMLDDAPTPSAKIGVWMRAIADLPLSISQQQLHYANEAFTHETAHFVKRNTIISGFLFLPFFLLVVINDATAHGLYRTWFWSFDVLLTWILLLPAAGFLLSTTTLLVWLAQNHRERQRTWIEGLRDVRHNWLMSVPILLGLAILSVVLFHDSVHCVLGNPIDEAHHWSSTLRCIQQR
ncbi:MAG TPA: hypothetical protein VIM53_00470 [Candidatus Saccharimonadales bacterium]